MEISKELISNIIKESFIIIKEIHPNFILPNINYIKLTNAKSYWANIGRIKNEENSWGIHLSKYNFSLIEYERDFHNMLYSCMIHELIHTIPKCDNHGKKFKCICELISQQYPEYHPYKGEKFIKLKKENPQRPKYLLKCSVCNYEYKYCRKPKYSTENYVCKCGNKSLKLISI